MAHSATDGPQWTALGETFGFPVPLPAGSGGTGSHRFVLGPAM